jgi:uncharacterized delta-60 repeat protein
VNGSRVGGGVALIAALVCASACNLPYPADVSVDAAAPFTLDVANDHFYLRTGGTVESGVTITRGMVSGDVTISVDAPPVGVTFDPLTIPSGATSGTLVAHAMDNAAFGRGTTMVKATAGDVSATDVLDLDVIGKFGDLDTTFGTGGTAVLNASGGAPRGLFAQGDKLVVVAIEGQGAQARGYSTRLLPDGSVDPSFGTAGFYIETFQSIGLTNFSLEAAAMSDGRIVIAGDGYNGSDFDPYLVILTPDGQIDVALRRIDTSAQSDTIEAIAIDTQHPAGTPDRIYLGGATFNADNDALLMRLTASGDVDPTFGGGRVVVVKASSSDSVASIAPQSTGVVALTLSNSNEFSARYDVNGTPDAGFSASFRDKQNAPWVNAVGLANDTGFLGWGEGNGKSAVGVDSVLAVWRCLSDGTPDGQFGSGGIGGVFETPVAAKTETMADVAALPGDSGFIGVGYELDPSGTPPYTIDLIRLTPVGEPDTNVGPNGVVQDTTVNLKAFYAAAMTDHRFSVVGIKDIGTSSPSMAVRRYFW